MEGKQSAGTQNSKRKKDRYGLVFSHSKVNHLLKKGRYAKKLGIGASLFLTESAAYFSAMMSFFIKISTFQEWWVTVFIEGSIVVGLLW